MGKIKLRHGSHEIELEGDDTFVASQLKAFYERIGSAATSTAAPQLTATEILQIEPAPSKSGPDPTPAEFFRSKSKGKADGITQLLIFAKYLELFRRQTEFSQKELNTVVQAARLGKDIHGQYFSNAVKQGLLRNLGRGRYSLTLSAEDVFAAL